MGEEFKRGQRFRDLSARVLNRMLAATRQVEGLTVGDGLALDRNARGLTIRLAPDPNRRIRDELVVAVVEAPDAEASTVRVRAVEYKNFPPRQDRASCDDGLEPTCRYAWAGPPFTAWPDFGTRAEDFSEFVWLEELPKLETTWLRCRFDRVWILERPAASGGGSRYVVVREIPDPTANFVRVQDIRPARPGGIWDGNFEAVGDPWPAAVYPWSIAGDYDGFLWPAERPLTATTPILPVVQVWGAWWLEQYVRWEIPRLAGDLVRSDCVPHVTTVD